MVPNSAESSVQKRADCSARKKVHYSAVQRVVSSAQKMAGMKVEGLVRQLVDSGRFRLALVQVLL